MQAWLIPYTPALIAFALAGALMLLQLLVADLAAIRAHHPPGSPVATNHGDFLFRATRAHANTNESIAVFLIAVSFGVLSAASPSWINFLSGVYLVARTGHMLFYYLNLQLPRSLSFAASVLSLFGMLVTGALAWLH